MVKQRPPVIRRKRQRVMSPQTLQRIIEQTMSGDRGLFCKLFAMNERVLRYYLSGQRRVPYPLAVLLRALRDQRRITPAYLRQQASGRWIIELDD